MALPGGWFLFDPFFLSPLLRRHEPKFREIAFAGGLCPAVPLIWGQDAFGIDLDLKFLKECRPGLRCGLFSVPLGVEGVGANAAA
jgi:hypothetical protein